MSKSNTRCGGLSCMNTLRWLSTGAVVCAVALLATPSGVRGQPVPQPGRILRPPIDVPFGGRIVPAPTQPPKPATAPKPEQPAIHVDGRLTLELLDELRLIGRPLGWDRITLDGAFGPVHIPLAIIATIDIAQKDRTATVRFRNGDRLTGTIPVGRLDLETPYGNVSVPLTDIVRIVGGVTKLPGPVARVAGAVTRPPVSPRAP
jgi:hypothetical protein